MKCARRSIWLNKAAYSSTDINEKLQRTNKEIQIEDSQFKYNDALRQSRRDI